MLPYYPQQNPGQRLNPEVTIRGGYANSTQHLLGEMGRIALKVRLELIRSRLENNQQTENEFSGLYISEEEIDRILNSNSFQTEKNTESNLNNPALKFMTERLSQAETEIAERKEESEAAGMVLRLVELGKKFQLNSFDIDALLICLLPELEPGYEKLYSYLQNDITKKQPSIELILRLLCISTDERLAARQSFTPQAPLIKHLLLQLDESTSDSILLLAKPLKSDERILNYLLESDEIDHRLSAFAQQLEPSQKISDIILPDEIKSQLNGLVTREDINIICYFEGAYGVGKQTTAEALCNKLNLPLLIVDVPRLLADELPLNTVTRLVFREATLQHAALYWKHFDILLTDEMKHRLDSLTIRLKESKMLNILGGEKEWEASNIQFGKPFVQIKFPVPDYDARFQLWQLHLNHQLPVAPDVDIASLSTKFLLSGGQIRDAVVDAQNRTLWQSSQEISEEDLYASCRAQSNRKLRNLAQKVETLYTWDDIVLPKEQMTQLHEIVSYVQYRQLVFGEWNFNEKLSLGKGLNALFAGPSGTGKTMAAGIMANELKLDMYKIDLSTVVSKYIGETEKNLREIFKEAETSNSILFFDEADALFGKRSEVRDSHDRYANIEISYLLQKMEEYEGIVILATNLHKNMDEAFVRRMNFVVEFPSPEEEHRFRIWSNIFPEKAPLDKKVDFKFMAKQFKITGGSIKNIALSASFLAADDGSKITMKHIIRATKREFQKMGKLYSEADFGKYYTWISSTK